MPLTDSDLRELSEKIGRSIAAAFFESPQALSVLRVTDLQGVARWIKEKDHRIHVSTSGNKSELVQRILDAVKALNTSGPGPIRPAAPSYASRTTPYSPSPGMGATTPSPRSMVPPLLPPRTPAPSIITSRQRTHTSDENAFARKLLEEPMMNHQSPYYKILKIVDVYFLKRKGPSETSYNFLFDVDSDAFSKLIATARDKQADDGKKYALHLQLFSPTNVPALLPEDAQLLANFAPFEFQRPRARKHTKKNQKNSLYSGAPIDITSVVTSRGMKSVNVQFQYTPMHPLEGVAVVYFVKLRNIDRITHKLHKKLEASKAPPPPPPPTLCSPALPTSLYSSSQPSTPVADFSALYPPISNGGYPTMMSMPGAVGGPPGFYNPLANLPETLSLYGGTGSAPLKPPGAHMLPSKTSPTPSSSSKEPTKIEDSDEDDDDLIVSEEIVSLRDPISMSRISQPAKGSKCGHKQCFDLQTYIMFCHQSRVWNCPICEKQVPWTSLVLDSKFSDILSQISDTEVDKIMIHPDGKITIIEVPNMEKGGSGSGSGGAAAASSLPVSAPPSKKQSDPEIVCLDDSDDDVEQQPAKPMPPVPAPPLSVPFRAQPPTSTARPDPRTNIQFINRGPYGQQDSEGHNPESGYSSATPHSSASASPLPPPATSPPLLSLPPFSMGPGIVMPPPANPVFARPISGLSPSSTPTSTIPIPSLSISSRNPSPMDTRPSTLYSSRSSPSESSHAGSKDDPVEID